MHFGPFHSAQETRIELGDEPPLRGYEGRSGLSDKRQVSLRWLAGTVLTGLTSLVLMGGALMAALDGEPLPKPADHRGGSATDMFRLDLNRENVLHIHDQMANAVRTGRTTSATRARGLGGFEEAWREYLQQLEKADVL